MSSNIDIFIRLIGEDKFTSVLQNSTAATQKLNDSLSKITSKAEDTTTAAVNLNKQVAGRTFQNWGRQINTAISGAIEEYREFNKAIAETGAIMGASKEEIEGLEDAARKMAKGTIFNAHQVAEAFYTIASAGISASEDMEKMASTGLKLATGAGADARETMELLVSTMNMFGLSIEDVDSIADTFAGTISFSQALIGKLATSLGYVGASANVLGYNLQDTSIQLAILYDAGLDASKAGTALREVYSKLAAPTSAGAKILKKYGIEIYDSSGKIRDMKDIMKDLSDGLYNSGAAMEDLTDETSTLYQEMVTAFGKRGMVGAVAMMDKAKETGDEGAKTWEDYREAITNTGKTQDMYNIIADASSSKMQILENQIMDAKIAFGEALLPILLPVIEALTEMTDIFDKMPQPMQDMIAMTAIMAGMLLTLAGAYLIATVANDGFNKACSRSKKNMGIWIITFMIIYALYKAGFFDSLANTILFIAVAIVVFSFAMKKANISMGPWYIAFVLIAAILLFLYSNGYLELIAEGFMKLGEAFKNGLAGTEYYNDILNLVDVVKWLIDKLKDLKDVIDSIGNAGNTLSGLDDMGSFGIQGFAKGGTVPGPIGRPQLAVVHGGEKITPNGEESGGTTININNPSVRSDNDINKIVFAVKRELKRDFKSKG